MITLVEIVTTPNLLELLLYQLDDTHIKVLMVNSTILRCIREIYTRYTYWKTRLSNWAYESSVIPFGITTKKCLLVNQEAYLKRSNKIPSLDYKFWMSGYHHCVNTLNDNIFITHDNNIEVCIAIFEPNNTSPLVTRYDKLIHAAVMWFIEYGCIDSFIALFRTFYSMYTLRSAINKIVYYERGCMMEYILRYTKRRKYFVMFEALCDVEAYYCLREYIKQVWAEIENTH